MILPIIIILFGAITLSATSLMNKIIFINKSLISFSRYLQKQYDSEQKIISIERTLREKIERLDYNASDFSLQLKNLLSSSLQLIGFVPDHLTFGCKEGMYLFKIEFGSLQTYVAIRIQ